MRAALLAVAVIGALLVLILATVRVGAWQGEPDLRTFVFVRGPSENIAGAEVVFVGNEDGERWLFPYTNEGGWTRRSLPDGKYRVAITAAGWQTRMLTVAVPTGDRYKHRTFTIHLKPKP